RDVKPAHREDCWGETGHGLIQVRLEDGFWHVTVQADSKDLLQITDPEPDANGERCPATRDEPLDQVPAPAVSRVQPRCGHEVDRRVVVLLTAVGDRDQVVDESR